MYQVVYFPYQHYNRNSLFENVIYARFLSCLGDKWLKEKINEMTNLPDLVSLLNLLQRSNKYKHYHELFISSVSPENIPLLATIYAATSFQALREIEMQQENMENIRIPINLSGMITLLGKDEFCDLPLTLADFLYIMQTVTVSAEQKVIIDTVFSTDNPNAQNILEEIKDPDSLATVFSLLHQAGLSDLLSQKINNVIHNNPETLLSCLSALSNPRHHKNDVRTVSKVIKEDFLKYLDPQTLEAFIEQNEISYFLAILWACSNNQYIDHLCEKLINKTWFLEKINAFEDLKVILGHISDRKIRLRLISKLGDNLSVILEEGKYIVQLSEYINRQLVNGRETNQYPTFVIVPQVIRQLAENIGKKAATPGLITLLSNLQIMPVELHSSFLVNMWQNESRQPFTPDSIKTLFMPPPKYANIDLLPPSIQAFCKQYTRTAILLFYQLAKDLGEGDVILGFNTLLNIKEVSTNIDIATLLTECKKNYITIQKCDPQSLIAILENYIKGNYKFLIFGSSRHYTSEAEKLIKKLNEAETLGLNQGEIRLLIEDFIKQPDSATESSLFLNESKKVSLFLMIMAIFPALAVEFELDAKNQPKSAKNT